MGFSEPGFDAPAKRKRKRVVNLAADDPLILSLGTQPLFRVD